MKTSFTSTKERKSLIQLPLNLILTLNNILATLTTVNDIIEHNTKSSKVNVSGRVSFDASPETIQANGKTLQKLETVLTDETGSIRLVLWEKDIDCVQNGLTYKITQALVKKNFNSNKNITLNRQSLIAEAQITMQPSDEQLLDNQLNTVSCPVGWKK